MLLGIEKSFLKNVYTSLWDSCEEPTFAGKICNWFQYKYFNLIYFCSRPVCFEFITKKEEILEIYNKAEVRCYYMERIVAPIGYELIWFKNKNDYITAKLIMNEFFVEMEFKDELDYIDSTIPFKKN